MRKKRILVLGSVFALAVFALVAGIAIAKLNSPTGQYISEIAAEIAFLASERRQIIHNPADKCASFGGKLIECFKQRIDANKTKTLGGLVVYEATLVALAKKEVEFGNDREDAFFSLFSEIIDRSEKYVGSPYSVELVKQFGPEQEELEAIAQVEFELNQKYVAKVKNLFEENYPIFQKILERRPASKDDKKRFGKADLVALKLRFDQLTAKRY